MLKSVTTDDDRFSVEMLLWFGLALLLNAVAAALVKEWFISGGCAIASSALLFYAARYHHELNTSNNTSNNESNKQANHENFFKMESED